MWHVISKHLEERVERLLARAAEHADADDARAQRAARVAPAPLHREHL